MRKAKAVAALVSLALPGSLTAASSAAAQSRPAFTPEPLVWGACENPVLVRAGARCAFIAVPSTTPARTARRSASPCPARTTSGRTRSTAARWWSTRAARACPAWSTPPSAASSPTAAATTTTGSASTRAASAPAGRP
ncbi:hypothetical protein ACFQV2_17935 [Actinokineospora soli]|uniref:Uncharacterized protein n=1 Tax=Actinokineospora soli TaxID=1048753 RepID=A0ABW2TP13_9PSEU